MTRKQEVELLTLVATIAVAVVVATVDFAALQQTYLTAAESRLDTLRAAANLDRLLVHYFSESLWSLG